MIRDDQHHAAGIGARKVLARWLLLAAVFAGVLALHVLTAEDHAANSGQFAVNGTAQLASAPALQPSTPATGSGGSAMSEPVGADGSQWLAGCVLFLTVTAPGALALLLVLLRRRRPPGSTESAGLADRGSTGSVIPMLLPPRLAAGVIRV